jgi:hypothetical protein
MNQHFSRIQFMTFTAIVVNDKAAIPQTVSTTGEITIENDGCD